MATVPFSTKLKEHIIAQATAPFLQIQGQCILQVQTDPLLLRTLLEEQTKDVHQVKLAYELHAINSAWFDKYYAHMELKVGDMSICMPEAASLSTARHTTTVYCDMGSDDYARTNKIFQQIMAPYYRAAEDIMSIKITLETIFDQCLNVNAALEVMPSILDWCPDNTRARLNTKAKKSAPRATADEVRAAAFSDASMAAIARARMIK